MACLPMLDNLKMYIIFKQRIFIYLFYYYKANAGCHSGDRKWELLRWFPLQGRGEEGKGLRWNENGGKERMPFGTEYL